MTKARDIVAWTKALGRVNIMRCRAASGLVRSGIPNDPLPWWIQMCSLGMPGFDGGPDPGLTGRSGPGVRRCSGMSCRGATEWPGFSEMLAYAQPGDPVVVWMLDRLGRSLMHLIQIVQQFQGQGIQFRDLALILLTRVRYTPLPPDPRFQRTILAPRNGLLCR